MGLRQAGEREREQCAPRPRATEAPLRRAAPPASGSGRPALLADLDAEVALIEADRAAPRRHTASVRAARHPDRNEDRVLCDPELGVAAVFDGIGGEAGGELASRAACGAMAIALQSLPPRHDLEGRRRWLAGALESCERAIALSRRLHEDAPGQGTTVVAAVLAGTRLLTACVGDSRAYRARNGCFELIADEHESVTPRPAMADAVDRVATVEDLARGPKDLTWAFMHRNIIGAALGDDSSPTLHEHEVAPGDLIAITSDGVHDNLAHEEIGSVLESYAPDGPQALSAALVRLAQQRSLEPDHVRAKDDDITCAVLPVPSR